MLVMKVLFHSSRLHSTVTQPEHPEALNWLMEKGAARKRAENAPCAAEPRFSPEL